MFRDDTNFLNEYDHPTWMIQVLKPLFLGKITVHYGYIIDGFVGDGQLFGANDGVDITISLENDEIVTALEYYNFPDPGHTKWDLLWRYELGAMSIFTTTSNGTQKQYGPYATSENNSYLVFARVFESNSYCAIRLIRRLAFF